MLANIHWTGTASGGYWYNVMRLISMIQEWFRVAFLSGPKWPCLWCVVLYIFCLHIVIFCDFYACKWNDLLFEKYCNLDLNWSVEDKSKVIFKTIQFNTHMKLFGIFDILWIFDKIRILGYPDKNDVCRFYVMNLFFSRYPKVQYQIF